MKKMMPVIAAVVVFLAAAIPFLNGIIMERTIKNAVKEYNFFFEGDPGGYSLEIISYNRGYLSTQIKWKLNTGILKNIFGLDSIIFREHAKHGYLGVVSFTSLEENDWYYSFVNDVIKGQNPLHIKTRYSIQGGIKATLTLDDFSTVIEGERLEMRQGKITVSVDRKMERYKVSAKWQGTDIAQKLFLGEVSLKSDMEMISRFIWEGAATLNLKSFKTSDTDNRIEISDAKLQVVSKADRKANALSSALSFSAERIHANDNTIDKASVHYAVSGINLDGYEEFMSLYFRMVPGMMTNINLDDPDDSDIETIREWMPQMEMQMVAASEKLLKEGLEIQISNLYFILPDGEVSGSITLRLKKDMTFIQFLLAVYQPRMLLDFLYLESDLRIPVKLAGDNPYLMQPFLSGMQTGLFIKDEDYLVHNIGTKDGKLYLNGKEVWR